MFTPPNASAIFKDAQTTPGKYQNMGRDKMKTVVMSIFLRISKPAGMTCLKFYGDIEGLRVQITHSLSDLSRFTCFITRFNRVAEPSGRLAHCLVVYDPG